MTKGSEVRSTGSVVGVDGCPGGWVLAEHDGSTWELSVQTDLSELMGRVRSGEVAMVGIDMPIGLQAAGPRECDREARQLLGPRRSSVFPSPIRAALGAPDHATASARSKAVDGRGLPIQAFHLLDRIVEVDDHLADGDLDDRVVEVHPELSFMALAGDSMQHPKRREHGRSERVETLAAHLQDPEVLVRPRPTGAKSDDVLDALAIALSVRGILSGRGQCLGSGVCPRGRPLTIWF